MFTGAEVINALNAKTMKLKLLTGIEPVTFSLPMRCATDCATAAYNEEILAYKDYFVKCFLKYKFVPISHI